MNTHKSPLAFVIRKDSQKPSPIKWTKDRLEQLVQRPQHRPPRDRSQNFAHNERNNSPMTMEDKSLKLTDLDLVNSLRAATSGCDAFNLTQGSFKSKHVGPLSSIKSVN